MVTIVDFLAQAIKDKPTDGSDCKTLEVAQKELGRLRRVTGKVVKVLSDARDLAARNGDAVAPAPPNAVEDRPRPMMTKARSKHLHRKAVTIDESFRSYEKVTVEKSLEERALIRSVIKGNGLFSDFADAELENFIDVFSPKRVDSGVEVITQGRVGSTFYVVQSGSLDVFMDEGQGETQISLPYGPGGSFGELALLYESVRTATVRASADSILWVLKRKAFKGLQLQIEQKAHERKMRQLESVKIGRDVLGHVMDLSQLESMAMATRCEKFEAGTTIIKEGEIGNTFYIITKGEVDVYKKAAGNAKIVSLGVNSFFGEKALLSSDTRQATCVAATNVECLTLARDDFSLMLGSLEDVLKGLRASMKDRSSVQLDHRGLLLEELGTMTLEEEKTDVKISLQDLKIKRVLGEGAFGKVALAKSKSDGKIYALKACAKSNIVKNGVQDKVINEYRLMKELSHPFLVRCLHGFQDKKYVYFLLVLLPGGEILDLLEKYDKFPESWTRFYCGIVVLVYEFLHQQKIAYRDLKPENLVLDEQGYCHVIDLGIAKKCVKGKTWTMCGTPDYLAPEIVGGKGHDWGADYWSLGILLYELTHGLPPFYDEYPANTPKKVMKGKYSIPTSFSRPLVDLISRLLTTQAKRLGRTAGGARKIRKHAWFEDIDWQALLKREVKVPWEPKPENLEKLGSKFDGKWDAPESDWQPVLDGHQLGSSWALSKQTPRSRLSLETPSSRLSLGRPSSRRSSARARLPDLSASMPARN